ncbi:hypothetical protein F4808DRAFT_278517 [Astrocystis sublimbata]|nr:hypothetical protein F4808DRAFT_278517 [Astrocystis sublimbata]
MAFFAAACLVILVYLFISTAIYIAVSVLGHHPDLNIHAIRRCLRPHILFQWWGFEFMRLYWRELWSRISIAADAFIKESNVFWEFLHGMSKAIDAFFNDLNPPLDSNDDGRSGDDEDESDKIARLLAARSSPSRGATRRSPNRRSPPPSFASSFRDVPDFRYNEGLDAIEEMPESPFV